MTKEQAMHLSLFDRDYYAKPVRRKSSDWGVWCRTSDHWVEFDQRDIDRAGRVDSNNEYKEIK